MAENREKAEDSWSENYEETVCHGKNRSGEVDADVVLVCSNPTVEKLGVEILEGGVEGRQVNALFMVTNSAEYPILVRSLIIDAKNESDELVDFCSINVEEPLQPNESFEHHASCSFPEKYDSKIDQTLASFSIKASPWH